MRARPARKPLCFPIPRQSSGLNRSNAHGEAGAAEVFEVRAAERVGGKNSARNWLTVLLAVVAMRPGNWFTPWTVAHNAASEILSAPER